MGKKRRTSENRFPRETGYRSPWNEEESYSGTRSQRASTPGLKRNRAIDFERGGRYDTAEFVDSRQNIAGDRHRYNKKVHRREEPRFHDDFYGERPYGANYEEGYAPGSEYSQAFLDSRDDRNYEDRRESYENVNEYGRKRYNYEYPGSSYSHGGFDNRYNEGGNRYGHVNDQEGRYNRMSRNGGSYQTRGMGGSRRNDLNNYNPERRYIGYEESQGFPGEAMYRREDRNTYGEFEDRPPRRLNYYGYYDNFDDSFRIAQREAPRYRLGSSRGSRKREEEQRYYDKDRQYYNDDLW